MCTLFKCEEHNLHILGHYEIFWDDFDNDDLTVVLACTIVGLLIPDRHAHGFPIGWGCVKHDTIIDRCVFSWGPCLLVTLYHQMHGIVYLQQKSVGCGITLLQTWAWEHIAIFHLVLHMDLELDQPYAFGYTVGVWHRASGNILYWHHQIDILQYFSWRPYLT